MSPNATHANSTGGIGPAAPQTSDLHPDVQSVIAATERLPVYDDPPEPLTVDVGETRAKIQVPDTATEAEVAAATTALASHLATLDHDSARVTAEPRPWQTAARLGRPVPGWLRERAAGRRWRMAGRFDSAG
jgi:hypothetical protein